MIKNWKPSASPEVMQQRAQLYKRIRLFMEEKGVMEVETPSLDRAANSEPNINSLSTELSFPDKLSTETFYLHTSPEFPMKRLLAAGSGSIYQICKVYRDDEVGRLHQPELNYVKGRIWR